MDAAASTWHLFYRLPVVGSASPCLAAALREAHIFLASRRKIWRFLDHVKGSWTFEWQCAVPPFARGLIGAGRSETQDERRDASVSRRRGAGLGPLWLPYDPLLQSVTVASSRRAYSAAQFSFEGSMTTTSALIQSKLNLAPVSRAVLPEPRFAMNFQSCRQRPLFLSMNPN
jgi:hypothetical protein